MANEVYKVKIISVDKDTGVEKVEVDDTLANVFMVGAIPEDENRFSSIVMGVSTMAAATMLASSKSTVPAVRLANCLLDLQRMKSSNAEEAFLNAMMKG